MSMIGIAFALSLFSRFLASSIRRVGVNVPTSVPYEVIE